MSGIESRTCLACGVEYTTQYLQTLCNRCLDEAIFDNVSEAVFVQRVKEKSEAIVARLMGAQS